MKTKSLIVSSTLIFCFGLSLFPQTAVHAGGCFQDPIFERTWTGRAKIDTRVRDLACMEGSKVLTVVKAKGEVAIIGETDGWYKVRLEDGIEGWMGATLIEVISKEETPAKTVVKKKTTKPRKKVVVRKRVKAVKPVETKSPVVTEEKLNSSLQTTFSQGDVPTSFDLAALNQYWLEKINALRQERGLRQLTVDQRWVDTASEWAEYMGKIDQATHDRPDGKSMHKWIDGKGLTFTTRNSSDGWKTNYFTENISWQIISSDSLEEMKKALDDTLEFYLAEAPFNGSHYRTIYHADWNSVGSGFYFKKQGNRYQMYMAFHYGSLASQ